MLRLDQKVEVVKVINIYLSALFVQRLLKGYVSNLAHIDLWLSPLKSSFSHKAAEINA